MSAAAAPGAHALIEFNTLIPAPCPRRYMVVLRMGGVYADVDTECRRPLNALIAPRDTLIVGWENEFATLDEARGRKYVRARQVNPSPKHPP